MDKGYILKDRYFFRANAAKGTSNNLTAKSAKDNLTISSHKSSRTVRTLNLSNRDDTVKVAPQSLKNFLTPISDRPSSQGYLVKSIRSAAKLQKEEPVGKSIKIVSKVSENMNHNSTRNSDLLISRMLSEMAEKKAITTRTIQDRQVDRLLQDRRRLSRFITEPSNLQLGIDYQWSIKDLDEVANPQFWKLLEQDRAKEITREEVKKMVLLKGRTKNNVLTRPSTQISVQEIESSSNLGRMNEHKLVKDIIQSDIEEVREKEEEIAKRVVKNYKPIAIVRYSDQIPPSYSLPHRYLARADVSTTKGQVQYIERSVSISKILGDRQKREVSLAVTEKSNLQVRPTIKQLDDYNKDAKLKICQTRKKQTQKALKKVTYRLAHLSKLGVTLNDLKLGLAFPVAAFEHPLAKEFISAAKEGDTKTLKMLLKKNKFLVHQFDVVIYFYSDWKNCTSLGSQEESWSYL